MTTYDFAPLFRSTIGFDRLAHLVEDAMRRDETGPAFPPYNIVKTGENSYRITLAVAGYSESDLSVESKENTLTVTGGRKPADEGVSFLHRGIAEGSFKRTFQLADYVRVANALYENGLLHIELVREIPEAMKPRRIEINSSPMAKVASKAKKMIEGKAA